MTRERQYYDALYKIARTYQTTKQMRRNAGQYGLEYEEELEMAYENMQAVAEMTIKGKRPPKLANDSSTGQVAPETKR